MDLTSSKLIKILVAICISIERQLPFYIHFYLRSKFAVRSVFFFFFFISFYAPPQITILLLKLVKFFYEKNYCVKVHAPRVKQMKCMGMVSMLQNIVKTNCHMTEQTYDNRFRS